jgi:eukaryotic-like serine/threonine-protein kinase
VTIGTGTKLGQYEVQDFIGQGAMGLVYRAYHVQLERTGAVKVLQAIAPDPDTTARFRHEAQAIAQLRHPNILNVYDFGEYQGTPYMIVEYVPGGSLANKLSDGLLDQAAALRYLRGIAAGLDYAHEHGIVHRDVKPANVLLEKDNTPVLADFGLAKLLQGSSLKSMTGVTTGTPAYMAPEQVAGSRVGPAADRYSLATIAYEMLTGVIPFDGEGLLELLYAQVHREPLPPSSRNTSLRPKVDAVIMRGLAKDPAARWETCTEFVDALSAALTHGPEPAVARTMVMAPAVASTMPLAAAPAPPMPPPPSYVESEDSGAAAAVAFPSPPPSRAKRKVSTGTVVGLAAVLILLLVIGTVGYLGYVATHQAPTFAVSPSTVVAGDTVLVTAKHLPNNQTGEIRLHSELVRFPFRADRSGALSGEILIPFDSSGGDHLLELCWASRCHVSAILHVLEQGSSPTPSPGESPSPTPGATPGATPAPGSSPTPVGGPSPTPRASPIPAASPTPKTTPTPKPPAAIALSSSSVKVGGSVTVSGSYFTPGSTATITFKQATASPVGTASVNSVGSFSRSVNIPITALPGAATITACDTSGRCASQPITVTLT